VPSIIITILVFVILGFFQEQKGNADILTLLNQIELKFKINYWLFIVPAFVVFLISRKTPPLIALFSGTILGAIFALIFQPDIILELSGEKIYNFSSAYRGVLNAITIGSQIETDNKLLYDLFSSGGMKGMLDTIWLIICAMVFGGIMEAIGALSSITNTLLSWAKNTFQLFASTVATCLTINLTASDQYLAIVIPGRMFSKAYQDRNLAPENLSRTLEDSGTVTSALIPWNTCGAYQASVLNVSVADYFIYAVFNWISPFITLLYVAFKIKIRSLK